jgi:hypothetical protein
MATKSVSQAVVVGLNYPGTEYELHGCVADAKAVAELLTQRSMKVTLITDDDGPVYPETFLGHLMECSADTVYLYFSGHGSQRTVVPSNSEPDGRDECLVFHGPTMFLDNQLRVLCDKLRDKGVRLVCLFDCCHSGTMLDARVNVRVGAGPHEVVLTINPEMSVAAGDRSVSLSACMDPQVALENQGRGLFTLALVQGLTSQQVHELPALMRGIDAATPEGQRCNFACNSVAEIDGKDTPLAALLS